MCGCVHEACDHTAGGSLARPVDAGEGERGELDGMEISIRHEEIHDCPSDHTANIAWFELRRFAFLRRQQLRGRMPVDRRSGDGDDDLRYAMAPGSFEGGER